MLELLPQTEDNFIVVKAAGKITRYDFDKIVSIAEEKIIKYGKTRWFIEIVNFRGWEFKAAIDDIRFSFRNYNNIEKIALVVEKKRYRWASKLSRVFTAGKVKYFDESERDIALNWARSSV